MGDDSWQTTPCADTFRARDGYDIHVTSYSPPNETRAAIACIHGIQSHAGWYDHSCRQFCAAGYHVFFADRRGSGKNHVNRGDCRNSRQLVQDLSDFISFVRLQAPGKPVLLLAISWGGKLAVAALKRDPGLVGGLILVCPGWFAKVGPSLREKVRIGWFYLVRPRHLIDIPLSDPALFTENPKWQEFLRTDPLSLRRGTARLLMASRWLDRAIAEAPSHIAVPSLLLLAGKDRIIDNPASRQFYGRFAGERQLIEYPHACHTLEFEPDPAPFINDVLQWLAVHVKAGDCPAANDGGE